MRFLRLTVVLCLAASLVVGCTPAQKTVGPDADGTRVDLDPGQTLAIELPSNPTTGYSWQVIEVPDQLEQSGEPEFASESDGEEVVGAGGTETIRFEAASSGTGTLLLEYRRPWEATATAEDTFELDVTVR